jgi:uncharacterized protein YjbI with pentapeptide repeats
MAAAEAGVSMAAAEVSTVEADFTAAGLVGCTGADFTPADFMAVDFMAVDFTPARFTEAGSTVVSRARTMVSATGAGLTGIMAGTTDSTAGFGVTG